MDVLSEELMDWSLPILLLVAVLIVCTGVLLWRLFRLEAERTRLRQLTERLFDARDNERQQIAEELHDSIGQNLLVVKGRAQLGLATAVNPNASQQFEEIAKVCASTIDETRRIAYRLGPRYLGQLGLTGALDAMIDKVAESTSTRFERRLENVDDLYEIEPATALYRIVQEALNNILKHARATNARVELIRDVDEVRLKIEDDGCGFELPGGQSQSKAGLGLAELKERARMLGATLEIRSQPGRGTTVAVTLPIEHDRTA